MFVTNFKNQTQNQKYYIISISCCKVYNIVTNQNSNYKILYHKT